MVNLAWMSTVTHLITLTALRKELRSNQFNKILRITVMGVLMLMLICVTAPIGYLMATGGYYFESTDLPAEFPAWCLYNPSAVWNTGHDVNDPTTARMDYNWVYIALAIGILVFTYCTRVIMLFSDNIGYTLLRIPPGQPWIFIEKGLENNATDSSSKRGARVKDKLLRSASMILLSGNRLYGSKAWEVRALHLLEYFTPLLTKPDHLVVYSSCLGDTSDYFCAQLRCLRSFRYMGSFFRRGN